LYEAPTAHLPLRTAPFDQATRRLCFELEIASHPAILDGCVSFRALFVHAGVLQMDTHKRL
jgi:hypothetical protein